MKNVIIIALVTYSLLATVALADTQDELESTRRMWNATCEELEFTTKSFIDILNKYREEKHNNQ